MLSMAVSILALQRQVTELRAQVETMRTTKPKGASTLRRAIGLARILGRFLETKHGQALVAIIGPAIAAFVKWLVGNS
jgi:ribosomal protein L29